MLPTQYYAAVTGMNTGISVYGTRDHRFTFVPTEFFFRNMLFIVIGGISRSCGFFSGILGVCKRVGVFVGF